MKEYGYLQDTSFHNEVKDNISLGKIGIEKESFRFRNSEISKNTHPKILGSALCNKFITTDFGESLLEFVTDPFENNASTLNFLDNIHYFVLNAIDDELLWPFSIPPYVYSEDDIAIADYGSSNLAKLKMTYRNGLSNRYGRVMQSISGIHFNYSIDPEIINIIINREKSSKVNISKNDIYFRTIRNLTRLNWFILYLFGSSPIVNKNFIGKNKNNYKQIKDMLVMEEATSLRMSDIGYYVVDQQNLDIPINNLAEYLDSLIKYTKLVNPEFDKIKQIKNEQLAQINSSYLQIEDEYYAVARPKSSLVSDQRMINKLKKKGVDYIELRSLDINPFKKAGIGLNDLKFLEAFMIFCTFLNSPEITFEEIKIMRANDLKVSTHGRKKGLQLNKQGQIVTLKEWAMEIFGLMQPVFELLSIDEATLGDFEKRILNSNHTPSAKLINTIKNNDISFHDLALDIALEHKQEYNKSNSHNSEIQTHLSNEAKSSHMKQKELESITNEPFSEYLSKYLGY